MASTSDFEEYGYEPSGNQTSVRRRECRVITNSYDALERLTATIIADVTTGFGYNSADQVTLPPHYARAMLMPMSMGGVLMRFRLDERFINPYVALRGGWSCPLR